MKKLTLLLLPFYFLFQLPAATLVVDDDIGVNDGSSPFATIAAAITAATSGDIIDITGGGDNTHTEEGITVDKSLTFIGQGQNTTIVQGHAMQGSATDRVFNVNNGITVTFEDFTIRHGNHSSQGGGGIFLTCNGSSIITFTRMTFSNNNALDGGGMILSGNAGTVSLTECIFSDNSSTGDGGALRNTGADNFTLTRCSFTGNTATDNGGAIQIIENGSTSRFINCTIANNTSLGHGGGIEADNSTLIELINCTITGNQVTGSSNGGGISWQGGNLNLINTLVAGNSVNTGLGPNIYANVGSGTFNETTSLVESCTDGSGTCPSFTFTTANLGAAVTCNGHTYFEPQTGSDALDNGTAPGSLGIPSLDICDSIRVAPHDIGSYDKEGVAFLPGPIPTLSEWAMIILALLMGVMATFALKARMQPAIAGVGAGNGPIIPLKLRAIPFDKKLYAKVLALTLGAMIAIFAISILAFGYELTNADLPGTLIATPITAYMIHLWIK